MLTVFLFQESKSRKKMETENVEYLVKFKNSFYQA
jgi:hypothetical protein